ncbi:hypothetical protein [Haloplanus salinarum]|uniref:hypothetical protein n=1 Tax=Haloplanus salinarum TaxID=1912324 RepID=UPI00214C4EB5|nr:hypothetical protein [Haloplanus salinarum]
MSQDASHQRGGSRLTNGTNSVTPSDGGNSPESSHELPTPSERAAEFDRAYPDRSRLSLTERHGRRLRRSLVEIEYVDRTTESVTPMEDSQQVTEIQEIRPLTWSAAVDDLLESHERMRNTTLNFEHDDGTEWSRPSENRWTEGYQKRYFAQMKGWLRELTGGIRPSGGETDPSYANPTICLITRSASSTPDGDRLPPTDHDAELADSWSDVYHTLRNVMRSLGFELGTDWQYDRRQEPHTGKRGSHGTNTCYGHEHIVLVVDGSITPGSLRKVVEKHVDACEPAGPSAHDLDVPDWDATPDAVGTVECFDPDDVEDIAAYVASYCSIQPTDLLERSTEYQAWAAIKHATNTRTISRSVAAKQAAKADRCRQRAEDPKTEQEQDHGEEVVRAPDGAHHDVECAECGSSHDIPQETLTRARLETESSSDNGLPGRGGRAEAESDDDEFQSREEKLAELWPSAESAATVGESLKRTRLRSQIQRVIEQEPSITAPRLAGRLGEPPDLVQDILEEERRGVDPDEVVGISNPPEPSWSLSSVEVNGEKHTVACDGGGPEMVRVTKPWEKILRETKLGRPDADRTKWRCGKCNFATYEPDIMAGHLVECLDCWRLPDLEIVDEVLLVDIPPKERR